MEAISIINKDKIIVENEGMVTDAVIIFSGNLRASLIAVAI